MSVRLREMLDDPARVMGDVGLIDVQHVALLASMLQDPPYLYRLDDAFGEQLLLELSWHLEIAESGGAVQWFDFSRIRPMAREAGGYCQFAETEIFYLPTRVQALRMRTEGTLGHRISARENCGLFVDVNEEGAYVIGAHPVGGGPAGRCWVGTPAWRRSRRRGAP